MESVCEFVSGVVSTSNDALEVERLCAESRLLSSNSDFVGSIELLLRALYYEPNNMTIYLNLAKLYVCLKCYHQAMFSILTVFRNGRSREIDLILYKVSRKVGDFALADRVIPNEDQSVFDKDILEMMIGAQIKVDRYSSIPLIKKIMGDANLGLVMTDSVDIFIPQTPSNRRNPGSVLTFVNQFLVGTNVELRLISQENYGLFATKDFGSEEKLFQETPYAAFSHDINNCYHCCDKIVTKVKCSCGISFCSESCKIEAYEQYHSPLCPGKILKEDVFYGPSNTFARKVLGKALVINGRGKYLQNFPSKYGGLQYLFRQSSISEFSFTSAYIKVLTSQKDIYRNYNLPFIGIEWIVDFFEMFILNSICLGERDYLKMPRVLALVSSFFNHSQEPNCYCELSHGKITALSQKPINKNDQLFIRYLNDHITFQRAFSY
jgi:hypothetical protein